MSRCIGIDLGTTNSVAAVREATPKVIQNGDGLDHTRSVVSVHKGNLLVGKKAINNFARSPEDTVVSVKRLMGRSYEDQEVQKVKSYYQYKIAPANDGLMVSMGGRQHSPVDISAMILKKIKTDCELRLGGSVEYAVITVPAYFSEAQKEATRRAGMQAGLKVQMILTEPTAAAVAFGVENLDSDGAYNILVYDLGGGTFDVSVLTYGGGTYAERDIQGDMWLGGDNFDQKLMDRVIERIRAVEGIDPSGQPVFMAKLKEHCEEAKHVLSNASAADIFIPGVLRKPDGDVVDVEYDIAAMEFERLIDPDIERSLIKVRAALDGAGLAPADIHHVLLVGGSSMIPVVRRRLAQLFGQEKLRMDVDPMKCVAYGAAIMAARIGESWSCARGHANEGNTMVCTTPGCADRWQGPVAMITALPYGIRTQGDRFEVIIPKGTPYSAAENVFVHEFHTPAAGIRRLRVQAYSGEHEVATKNNLEATIWVELPPGIPEDTPLDVTFSLDSDGILNDLEVFIKFGNGIRARAQIGRGGSDDRRIQLERKLDQLAGQRRAVDRDDLESFDNAYGEAAQALSRGDLDVAEQKINQVKDSVRADQDPQGSTLEQAAQAAGFGEFIVSEYGYLLDPTEVQALKQAVAEARDAVHQKNENLAAQAKERIFHFSLPDVVYFLLRLTTCIARVRQEGQEVLAERGRDLKAQLEAALKRRDYPAFENLAGQNQGLIRELTSETDPQLPDPDPKSKRRGASASN